MKKYISLFLVACVAVVLSACDCCNKKCEPQYRVSVMSDTFGWDYMTNPKVLDLAKEIGVEGVQIGKLWKAGDKSYLTKAQLDEFKAKSKETGIKIPSLVIPALPYEDKATTVAYMKTVVDAAKELGAETILMPFFGSKAKLTEENDNKKVVEKKFNQAASILKELMPYAEKAGVLICLENTLSSDDNLRMLKTVGSPNLKVYFDTFNIVYYGHEEISSIEKLKGQIGEIHLKDQGHKLGSSNEMPKNFKACVDAIKKIGYKGWLCFEVHAFDHKKQNIMEVMKYNVQYVKDNFLK